MLRVTQDEVVSFSALQSSRGVETLDDDIVDRLQATLFQCSPVEPWC